MALIELKPEWILSRSQGPARSLDDVLALLAAVEKEKNLSRACAKLDVSYRHAWGLIQAASRALGAPLLHSVRGQGATLSTLGERLVRANARVAARLAPLLESLAAEIDMEMRQAIANPRSAIRIHASHAFAMDALRDELREQDVAVELKYCGSEDALASLAHGGCDLAGFHTPIGELESAVLERWRRWLQPRARVLMGLVTRRQGILVALGNPHRIASLADLTRPGLRFVNRQKGSGTRLLLDLLLQRDGVDPARIAGYDNVEYTHAAVGAHIASGMGDAGAGDETAARLFGLDFVPLLEERYFLACRAEAADSPPVQLVRTILRGPELKARLGLLRGVTANDCGRLLSVVEAYPQLAKPRSRPRSGAAHVQTRA